MQGSAEAIQATVLKQAHEEVRVRVLLASGANPDRADNSGRSARDYAMLGGKNNSLITLIESSSQGQGKQATPTYGPKL